MSVKIECPICLEYATKYCLVICTYCDYKTCNKCYKTFILSRELATTDCMNCRQPLDISEQDGISKKFIENEWKNHCRKIFAIQTKMTFPVLMKEIIIDRDIINEKQELLRLRKLLSTIKDEIINRRNNINTLLIKRKTPGYKGVGRHCSWNCNGFLYDEKETEGECGSCLRKTCLKCNKPIIDKNHSCNKDDIDSWIFIKKTSKSCPKCGIYIHRIEGCSQMWCVNCHTAFNYDTGIVETNINRIHNPHYYDYIYSDNNRNNQHQRCENGELIHISILYNVLALFREQCIYIQYITNYHRFINDYRDLNINGIQKYIDSNNEFIKTNAKKFIQNEISEKIFTYKNASCIIKRNKLLNYMNIITTFIEIQIDIFNQYFFNRETKIQCLNDINLFIKDIQSSIEIFNNTIDDLDIKYISGHLMLPINNDIVYLAIPNNKF